MIDLTLIKDLIELLAKSLLFRDLETIGSYFFKGYSAHLFGRVPKHVTIAPLKAAAILVSECQTQGKIKEFLSFVIELDGTLLNGNIVKLVGLENLLYRLSRTGVYFDYMKRKLVSSDQDKDIMPSWGVLRDGKEYQIIIASIDICGNSDLVQKHKPPIMEKVYYKFSEFLNKSIYHYNGRVWFWAGDGGIIAFRKDDGINGAVACCLEVLFTLPLFNSMPDKPIEDNIEIRIGMDSSNIKFYNDTGRIISDVINYASHLEKHGTCPNGLSISEDIFNELSHGLKKMFNQEKQFENKTAYTMTFNHSKALEIKKKG
jgi:class 3 adenylate cyclase